MFKITNLKSQKIFLLHLIGIILWISIIYTGVLSYDFVWDDIPFLKENELVRSLKNIPYFFTNGMPTIDSPIHYRPVSMISFAFDYFLWGYNPLGYHLTNLLFHVLSSVLIYLLLLKMIDNSNAAFISALIYAVHPTHCDAVCWIMARGDILAGFFVLLSFFSYLNKKILFALIFFIVGLLSKEMAITFPVIILAYTIMLEKDKRSGIKFSLYCFITVILYLIVRYYVLTFPFGKESPFTDRFFTSFSLVGKYLKIVFIPLNFKLLYYNLPVYKNIFHLSVIIPLLILAMIGFFVVKYWKKTPLLCFSVLFFFISLFPVSGLPALIDIAMIAERYLYLPMIAVAIFLGKVFEIIIEKKVFNTKVIYAVFFLIIILLSSLTFNRKQLWKDEFTFLTNMIKDAPTYHEAIAILGYKFMEKGNYEEAERLYKKSISIKPDYAEGLNSLSSLYIRKGEIELAGKYALDALHLNFEHPEAHSNLGIVFAAKQMYLDAEKEFKYAISIKPRFFKAYLNLAVLYASQGRFQEAKASLNEARKLNPEHPSIARTNNFIIEKLREYENNR